MEAQTFLDNFVTIADAPGGVQRLRDLVLELAVTGRLVPHDTDAQAAKRLISEAADARADLVKRGLVPKPRAFTADDDPPPFMLPSTWAWTDLENISVYIQRGKSPNYASAPTSTPVVSQKCVQWSGFDLGPARYVVEESLSGYGPERFLQAGDLLWNSTGTGTVGRVVAVPGDLPVDRVVADSHVTVVRLANSHPQFVRAWLASTFVQSRIEELTSGTTQQQELNTSTARGLGVPLPPRPEQERIVAKVDELMGLCDKLEARQERRHQATNRFRGSTLHALTEAESPDGLRHAWERASTNWTALTAEPESAQAMRETILDLAVQGRLVGQSHADGGADSEIEQARRAKALLPGLRKQPPIDPAHSAAPLPTGWTWATVDDLFLVTGGIQKSSKRRPTQHHFPYLRVANVQRGRLDLREIERFELVDGELERLRLEPGDLLVVEGNGSESEIGRCARWDGEIEDCVHQNHLIRCRPMLPAVEHYLLMFLNSPAGMATMKRLAVTTSGLYNLSVAKIRAISFPLPPMAERIRIREKVDSLLQQVLTLEATLEARDSACEALAEASVAAM